jgi:hypothetical protein
VPHAPQHRECGIDLPAIIEIFVEQRGNHHSHRGIAAPPIMPARLVEAGLMLSKLGWSREESC